MSQIQHQKARLEENYERLASTDPDDHRAQRAYLNQIMVDCDRLKIAPWYYLLEKAQSMAGTHSPLPHYGGLNLDHFVTDETLVQAPPKIVPHREYPCPKCGKGFATKQARAGHRPHCPKKGGANAQ